MTRYIGPLLARCLETLPQSTDHRVIERAVAAYRGRFERSGWPEMIVRGLHS